MKIGDFIYQERLLHVKQINDKHLISFGICVSVDVNKQRFMHLGTFIYEDLVPTFLDFSDSWKVYTSKGYMMVFGDREWEFLGKNAHPFIKYIFEEQHD